jgi:uncharacterized protein with beta-barrel porin domain
MLSAAALGYALTPTEAFAACDSTGGNIVCNGSFEVYQPVAGSDEISFDNWVSADPSAVRVGVGAGGTSSSAEFLFSPVSFSQDLSTIAGDRYEITFAYRSEGGQGFAAYFGDVKIFDYSGDEAGPIDWTEYTFNTQAFGDSTTLRFVPASFGAAQNIDLVSVTRCTTCAGNTAGNLGAVIDASQSFFTTDDQAGQGTSLGSTRVVTFDGGTLLAAGPGSLGTVADPLAIGFQVTSNGGLLNNDGQAFALAGTIVNTAAAATPFVVAGPAGGTIGSDIVNNGTLVVVTSGTTNFTGSIVNNSNGLFTVGTGGSVQISGGVTGGGVTVQGGLLSVAGTVNSSVTIGSGGVLRGNGSIFGTTTVLGTLRPGNSPGTLFFAGPVSQSAGSTLSLEIDGPGTANGAGNYSRVIVTGAGNSYTISDGVRLVPVLRGITYAPGETPGNNQYTLALGQRLQGVVQAEGGVFGSFSSVVQPNEGLAVGTRIVPVYLSNSIDLYVAPASYANYGGLRLNEAAAGSAVDEIIRSGGIAGRPIVNALVPLGAEGIAPALSSISGQNHANLPLAAIEAGQVFTNQISAQRIRFAEPMDGIQAWGHGFGSTARTEDGGNNPGFRSRLVGAILGVDFGSASGMRGGIAAGFGDGNVRGTGSNARAELRSYYVGAYLGIQKEALSVNGQIGVTFNKFNSKRTANVGALSQAASADLEGNTASAAVDVSYRFPTGAVSVQPIAFIRYDTVRVGDFVEQGAALLGLAVHNKRYSRLATGLGAKLQADLATSDQTLIQPEVHATWRHELKDPGYAATMSLGGKSFRVEAGSPGRDAALLGAGLGIQLSSTVRLATAYDLELSKRRTAHGVTGQLRIQW